MPLSVPNDQKTVRKEPYVPEFQPHGWSIRCNNQNGTGGFTNGKKVLTSGQQLDTVILGYQTFVGTVPPGQDWQVILDLVNEQLGGMAAQADPQDVLEAFATKLDQWTVIHHIPLPSGLDDLDIEVTDWPRYAVTCTLFHGVGTYKDGTGLFGEQGYFSRLSAAGLASSQVLTTIAFEEREKGNASWFRNEFSFSQPTASSAEGKFIKQCEKFIAEYAKEHDGQDFPIPPVCQNFIPIPASEVGKDNRPQTLAGAEFILDQTAQNVLIPKRYEALDMKRIAACIPKAEVLLPELKDADSTIDVEALAPSA